jgi:hypothetical protein
MHVADQILVEAFEVQIGGERVGPEAVFPDWSRLDRFGIVVTEPLGGLGASLLLGILDELGATPLATLVRGRLRALGTPRIPRGPRGETRVNPAGLTARQVEVLRLLGLGYTNAPVSSPSTPAPPPGTSMNGSAARRPAAT